MSVLPNVAGQSTCGAGFATSSDVEAVWTPARHASIAGQSAPSRTSFQTAAAYELPATAYSTCSLLRPSRPSAQALTISSVAPAPVGAPFAIETLGDADRSFRAPATPSSTQRSEVPSKLTAKHGSTTV